MTLDLICTTENCKAGLVIEVAGNPKQHQHLDRLIREKGWWAGVGPHFDLDAIRCPEHKGGGLLDDID